MNLKKKDTALLVFSLSAEQEIHRKTIFENRYKKENTAFFDLLIAQTKKLADQSGVDVFWIDEQQQHGTNFSSRFTNAFQKLFDAGYKNVVSIGNDCPNLSIEILRDAIVKLEKKSLVIGPSKDGGVYLLGMNNVVFENFQSQKLPWQTATLRTSLLKYANSIHIDFDVLTSLRDLDSFKDVLRYSKLNSSSLLSRFFAAIIASLKNTIKIFNDFVPLSLRHSFVGLRAPPIV